MVSFKLKNGVTISTPGSLKNPGVEQAIRDNPKNDIKAAFDKAMKQAMPNRMSKVAKKMGGTIKRRK